MAKELSFELLPYQIRILLSSKPYLALIGGTGSGKTFLLPRWLFVKMNENPGNEWIVSAPTIPMLKRNPWKYCLKFFEEAKIPVEVNKTDMIIRIPRIKSTIYFISAENPDRMQGIHAKGIIGDEAGMFDRLWWDTAVQRIAYKKGQILLLTTPYSENWLKTEVWDKWLAGDPSFHVENPTSLDNPFYPREEYERARQRLPEWKFRMLFEGKFTKPAGLIYPDYQIVERFKIPESWFVFGGVDFGFNNPFAVVWIAENPETEELYVFDEFKKTGLTIDKMEEVLKTRKCIYYGDPASKEALETLKARGIDIRPAKKDVLAGITYVQGLFKNGKLKIFKDLKYLIDELNSYQWEMDRREQLLDKPRKENDHLCDALRYAVFTVKGEPRAQIWAKSLGLTRTTAGIFKRF
jgi:PBSX family phage terminase large subunit